MQLVSLLIFSVATVLQFIRLMQFQYELYLGNFGKDQRIKKQAETAGDSISYIIATFCFIHPLINSYSGGYFAIPTLRYSMYSLK